MSLNEAHIHRRLRITMNIHWLVVLVLGGVFPVIRQVRPEFHRYYLLVFFYNLAVLLVKEALFRQETTIYKRFFWVYVLLDISAVFFVYNLGFFPLNFLLILYFLLIYNSTAEMVPGELHLTVALSIPAFLANTIILWSPGAEVFRQMGFGYLLQGLGIAASLCLMILVGMTAVSRSRRDRNLIAHLEQLLGDKENTLRQLYETNATLEEKYAASYTLTLIQQYLLHEMNEPQLLEKITDIIQGVLGSTVCAIFGLKKNDTESINLLAISGMKDPAPLLQLINQPEGLSFQVLGRETSGNERDASPAELAEWRRLGIQSFFLIPLFTKEEKIGLMLVAHSQEGVFNRDQLEFIQIIANQLSLALENILLHQQTQKLAWHDPLTGLYNRYYLNTYLAELEEDLGSDLALGCIIFDIDHFKQVNDRHGHFTGDQVLKKIAAIIQEQTRTEKGWLSGRFGGEEFILLNTADLKHLEQTAENIRRQIGLTVFTSRKGKTFSLTISGGIASIPEQAKDIEELIIKADEALYRAKRSGRNRVVIYS